MIDCNVTIVSVRRRETEESLEFKNCKEWDRGAGQSESYNN